MDVAANVSSARQATPDELAGLATQIWGEVRASGIAEADERGNDKLLGELQQKYADFSASFPLVLRWMVQLRRFSRAAFVRYLGVFAAAKPGEREEYLRLLAEYPVILFREERPRESRAIIQRYREAVVRQLLEEDTAFKEATAEVEAKMKEEGAATDAERRRALYALLARRDG